MCIYFETHDAKQLTKKMAEVSGRKADEKVRYKFRRYIEKFSWELYVRDFENILTPLDT